MVVFRTIRTKLIVGIVSLLIITSAAITLAATERTQAALRDQIEETHEAHAARIAQELDRRLQDAMAFAEAAARNDLFRRPVAEDLRSENGTLPPEEAPARRAFLQQLVATVDLFSSAAYVDTNATVVFAEPIDAQWRLAEEAPPEDGFSRLQVFVGLANEVDESSIQRGTGPGTWVAIAPLYTSDDRFHGILMFEGQNAPLVAFSDEAVDAEGTALIIVDSEGRVIAGPGPFVTGHDLARETRRLKDTEESSQIIVLSGEPYLATAFPLSSTAWSLILATETDVAFGAVQTILRTTILLGGIALVFGVAMSLVLAQGISIPVQRLQRASQRVTAGAYGTQVRVSTGDELADLAGAFNAMSARLQEENQRLLQYQESLEETVEERTMELREKNDELEAFVYAASHDMRTPVISLDWLVQELEDQIGGPSPREDIDKTIERIRANIDGMDDLISDLLELSRIGRTEGKPEPVAVRPIVDQAVQDLAPSIQEKGATLDIDVPERAVVLADRRRMQQVFSNLIGNAIKYGRDEGARVSVRAAPVGSIDRPWKWRFEVADNGPGIPPEHRERVFMLFQRAPDPLGRPIEGTGVGLAVVRKIILAYGGQIHVTEAPRGGALFWFTLPAPRKGPGPSGPRQGPKTTSSAPSPSLPQGRPSEPDEHPSKYPDDDSPSTTPD